MSKQTIKQKADSILAEKTSKIIPENIKKNTTIFDVTGTYEGNGNLNIIYDITELPSTASDGDICLLNKLNDQKNLTYLEYKGDSGWRFVDYDGYHQDIYNNMYLEIDFNALSNIINYLPDYASFSNKYIHHIQSANSPTIILAQGNNTTVYFEYNTDQFRVTIATLAESYGHLTTIGSYVIQDMSCPGSNITVHQLVQIFRAYGVIDIPLSDLLYDQYTTFTINPDNQNLKIIFSDETYKYISTPLQYIRFNDHIIPNIRVIAGSLITINKQVIIDALNDYLRYNGDKKVFINNSTGAPTLILASTYNSFNPENRGAWLALEVSTTGSILSFLDIHGSYHELQTIVPTSEWKWDPEESRNMKLSRFIEYIEAIDDASFEDIPWYAECSGYFDDRYLYIEDSSPDFVGDKYIRIQSEFITTEEI